MEKFINKQFLALSSTLCLAAIIAQVDEVRARVDVEGVITEPLIERPDNGDIPYKFMIGENRYTFYIPSDIVISKSYLAYVISRIQECAPKILENNKVNSFSFEKGTGFVNAEYNGVVVLPVYGHRYVCE